MKRNFFKYTLNPRALAMLLIVFVSCAVMVGVCKLSGYWFLAGPIVYVYLIFFIAYLFKNIIDWLRYRNK